ncbi:hypothetical protein Vretimale_9467 [Volvox reticuliferus]|uniref:Methyltransferase small domain-containing protein n=1 Tax=Volvox reticuliferus TaxID=1737510 RepID=A0A8J4D1E6_9CHLO|nr:hypothetical protein Vretifemale_18711 [Volvox reticuliferus]GIM04991.1 hypothetical protein Vretimale_9467 [Volvox reticuliferus]
MVKLNIAEINKTYWNGDVYEPSDDTFLLVDVLQQHAEAWVNKWPRCCLELGSGSGYVIASLALLLRQLAGPSFGWPAAHPRSCQLLAVDQSPAAVEATRTTLQAHKVTEVDVLAANLLGPLMGRLRGSVDVMVFNPPYVPTPDEEVKRGGIASAWAGGYRGRRVIDQVLPLLPELLSPRGELFMVTVTENDPQGIIEEMLGFGFQGRIAATRQADEETLQILHLWRQPPGLHHGAAAAGQ